MDNRVMIVGNWKMHGDGQQLAETGAIDAAAIEAGAIRVVLCPPATLIAAVCERVTVISVGAQDCHQEESGAFTGRLSAAMLAQAGATWIILGHSECRAFGDVSAVIRDKVARAAAAGLKLIVCVGETLYAREAHRAAAYVVGQLQASLPDTLPTDLVVAYEPIWAIGSGQIPTDGEIAALHEAIRRALIDRYGDTGATVPILYGGSVSADNVAAIVGLPEVGGVLVGGASLKADSFVPILASVRDSMI